MRFRHFVAVSAAVTLGVVLAGCSSGSTTSESSAAAASPAASAAQASEAAPAASDITIAMVSHGATGDAFWSYVKTGAEDGAADMQVNLDYQSSADLNEQAQMISAAVSKGVQGLVVSIPNLDALKGPIESATAAGIPVVVINSGQNDWQGVGAVGYVGQDEYDAGIAAGNAMKAAGVTKMLCINIVQDVQSVNLRCDAATEGFGGTVETIRIDPSDMAAGISAIAAKLQSDSSIDGVLSLGGGVFPQSIGGIQQAGSSAKLGTFDLDDTIMQSLKEGTTLFAIDQQPWVQGYQSIVDLAVLLKKGYLIGGGTTAVGSGPRVLTSADVQ